MFVLLTCHPVILDQPPHRLRTAPTGAALRRGQNGDDIHDVDEQRSDEADKHGASELILSLVTVDKKSEVAKLPKHF